MAAGKTPDITRQRAPGQHRLRRRAMHDEQHWLKHPILPRPPALPKFGRELCALLGLDPSDFERDTGPNGSQAEAASAAECGDTRPDALATGSELRIHAGVVRTGT
jgi:hypothetical protein